MQCSKPRSSYPDRSFACLYWETTFFACDLKVAKADLSYQSSFNSSKYSGPGVVEQTIGAKVTRFLGSRKLFMTSMNSSVVGIVEFVIVFVLCSVSFVPSEMRFVICWAVLRLAVHGVVLLFSGCSCMKYEGIVFS